MSTNQQIVIFIVGLICLLSIVWEWRFGYRNVCGHFATPFQWAGSMILRFIVAVLCMVIAFVPILAPFAWSAGFIVMGSVTIVILVNEFIRLYRSRNRQ